MELIIDSPYIYDLKLFTIDLIILTQLFTEPATKPLITYLWNTKKRSVGGIIAIKDAEARTFHRIVVSVNRLYNDNVKGYLCLSVKRKRGITNSLYEFTKTNIEDTA